LDYHLPKLVEQIYSQDPALERNAPQQDDDRRFLSPKYDAILVDEGQDFLPNWWQILRFALRPGGEMVLAADKTQNIYGTASAWTDERMEGMGFKGGRWAELSISYRLPEKVVGLAREYVKRFLPYEYVDLPEPQPELDLFPVELRWCQVGKDLDGIEVCAEELFRMMKCLRTDLSIADITLLVDTHDSGLKLVNRLRDKNIQAIHTFSYEKPDSQRKKRAFFQGDARVKATTLHSFKGWESRHVVVFIQSLLHSNDRALLYTALTRVVRHSEGSTLTVVACSDTLRAYGQRWPDYEEYRSVC